MMRRYIEHIKETHTPHERRQVAMRWAAALTGILFIAWLATLGVRLGNTVPQVTQNADDDNSAAALEAVQESVWRGY